MPFTGKSGLDNVIFWITVLFYKSPCDPLVDHHLVRFSLWSNNLIQSTSWDLRMRVKHESMTRWRAQRRKQSLGSRCQKNSDCDQISYRPCHYSVTRLSGQAHHRNRKFGSVRPNIWFDLAGPHHGLCRFPAANPRQLILCAASKSDVSWSARTDPWISSHLKLSLLQYMYDRRSTQPIRWAAKIFLS